MLSAARFFAILAALIGMAVSQVRAQEKLGTLLVAGDIASCVKPHQESGPALTEEQKREREIKSGRATAGLVIDQIRKSKEHDPNFPVAVLGLGDLAYDCGTAAAFRCFEESWGQIRKELKLNLDDRFLLVPGNHEYAPKRVKGEDVVCIEEKDGPKKEEKHANPFFEYYESDLEKLKASKGSYSINFPESKDKSWHLIGLNPYGGSPIDWLKEDVKNSQSKRCLLAFAHPFYYSSGYHGHRDVKDKKEKKAAKRALGFMKDYFEILYVNRVTVLLTGHDHHFEQLGRANASGAADSENGLRSFIVGTGGKPLYGNSYADQWPFQEAIDLKNYGILRIDLYADRYDWEFIPVQPAASSMKVIKDVKSDRCNRAAP